MAQVQPQGLKPKTKESTTTTRLDHSPDSRADCCPTSPRGYKHTQFSRTKDKTRTTKPFQIFLGFCQSKASHLLSDKPSQLHIILHQFFVEPEEAMQHYSCGRVDIIVFSLSSFQKLSLFGTFDSKLNYFCVDTRRKITVLISLRTIFVLGGVLRCKKIVRQKVCFYSLSKG